MLTVIRDAQDRILAACEWWLVNEQGVFVKWGRYVWVNDFETSPGDGLRKIRAVIRAIASAAPQAVAAYWNRPGKGYSLHAFKRKRLLQHLERMVRV